MHFSVISISRFFDLMHFFQQRIENLKSRRTNIVNIVPPSLRPCTSFATRINGCFNLMKTITNDKFTSLKSFCHVFSGADQQFIALQTGNSNIISIQEGRDLVLFWKYKLQSDRELEQIVFGILSRPRGIFINKLVNMKATDKVSDCLILTKYKMKGLLERSCNRKFMAYISLQYRSETKV